MKTETPEATSTSMWEVMAAALATVRRKKLAYPLKEAAELISVTPRQLQEAATARRIRFTRLGKGRGLLFTEEQLMDFLARNEVEVQQ